MDKLILPSVFARTKEVANRWTEDEDKIFSFFPFQRERNEYLRFYGCAPRRVTHTNIFKILLDKKNNRRRRRSCITRLSIDVSLQSVGLSLGSWQEKTFLFL